MHQSCTGTKKNKKKWNFQELWVHFWVVAGFFVFFGFFGACRCLVHLVVWIFFLVPVNVLWSQSHQTCTGTKKTKIKQTTRCTKRAQAPKKTKKLKFPGTMGPLLSSCWIFCFFWFFWCLSMFGASSRLDFFWGGFFGACQCFVKSFTKPAQAPKKTKKTNH